ncbi:hypothetical protein OAS23_03330 [Alphaproteobacteria bacterium]|nr:hypothetical protein [Alphaproteobacteria bacterium]
MDFYQAQHKYRQKQLKFVFSSILKLILVLFIFLAGWWFGNNDNLILIQENERILNEFNQTKNNLERKLTDIRLKLKESNLALNTRIIKDQKTDIGENAKKILASSLAKGIPENIIINNLILLGKNKICANFQNEELAVSTQSFVPPKNTLPLLSGSLKIKAEGNISEDFSDNPNFNVSKPVRVTLIYLGNNDIIEGKLPLKKVIFADKFSVNLEILESKVRGAVIVRYKTCKI